MKSAQEYLIAHDIRPSQQRLAIMAYLMSHHTHPTADDIYGALASEMPTLSRTTVYNTLNLFVEKGAIQLVTIDERNAHYDTETSVHGHFLCERCGKIYDIELPIQPAPESGTFPCNPNLKNFIVHHTQIYHIGICPQCKTLEK